MSNRTVTLIFAPLSLTAGGLGWHYGDFCIGLICAMVVCVAWKIVAERNDDRGTTDY